MPFQEYYSVDFSNGNLVPHLNILNWPEMTLFQSDQSVPGTSLWQPDPEGWVCTLNREPDLQTLQNENALCLAPAGGIPVQSRLRLQVIFDSAHASPAPGTTRHPEPWDPEPWAVVLKYSWMPYITVDPAIYVTTQFVREISGAPSADSGYRLNTPGSLQRDKAAYLESPIDYDLFKNYHYILDHYYCGYPDIVTCSPTDTKYHTTGCGRLTRLHGNVANEDVRVFSSDVFQKLFPPPLSGGGIQGLFASLVMRGAGSASVRFKNFSVWLMGS